MGLYSFLNSFFFVFHSALILFILFGWVWRRLRPAHLVSVGLVALSWFILGLRYGIGYCPCTDWHWQVRYELGFRDMSGSYVHFFITTITGISVEERTVDVLLVVGLIASAVISLILLLRSKRAQRG